ncbi:unnamed protein product [Vicia faba]|uniref:Uncharacterized protein n=1 Tax=Vicia faba TaxID=3906 RepID=A0AAV0Z2A3_VICFA|nr:unnamed protein product [Vicia faba]
MQTKPVKGRIESKQFGIISEIGDLLPTSSYNSRCMDLTEVPLFPQLLLHCLYRKLKGETNIGVESFEIRMSNAQKDRLVHFDFFASSTPFTNSVGNTRLPSLTDLVMDQESRFCGSGRFADLMFLYDFKDLYTGFKLFAS